MIGTAPASTAWTIEPGVVHLTVGRSYGDQRLTTDITGHGNPYAHPNLTKAGHAKSW
jgi:hypothetical protein